MMEIQALPDLIVASIALGIGLYELVGLLAKRPLARDYAFIALCLSCALFAAGCAGQMNSSDYAGTIPWLRLQYAANAAAGASLVGFFKAVTGCVSRRVFFFTAAVSLAFALAPYLFVTALRFHKQDPKKRRGLLVIPVILLAIYLNDLAVGLSVIAGPYLLEYAFIGIAIYAGLDRADRERAAEEDLQRLAYFDSLTGLPNRALFIENLGKAIARAQRFGHRLALLFLDLDRFKYVNDSLGHAAGDFFLVEIARRIKSKTRASDSISRLGGDEFTIILEGLAKSEDAAIVSQELLDEISRPFRVGGVDFFCGASIGVAVYPYDDWTAAGLTRKADAAMYLAKEAGGNGYRFISGETDTRNRKRIELEGELRRAVELGQFHLLYQPLVSMEDGRISGAEALLRWQPVDRSMISPSDFILLAEETGLIVPIGEWVLRTACAEAAGWAAKGHDIPVSINVSARQFRHDALPQVIEKALADSGLPADRLIIEVTESAIMHDLASAKLTMGAIRSLGSRVAIDDFGTGYSSLGYLAHFPVGELKIDQSFVRDIFPEGKMRSIVAAIIAMAKSLGIETVAEGIETEEQHRYLREQGCDTGQGYLFARPVEAGAFLELASIGYLRSRRLDPSEASALPTA